MGCGTLSRPSPESPPAALCRQRRRLIRSAADLRYALAAAHSSYFLSLSAVGDALHRFAHSELSPVLDIPPSDSSSSSSSSPVTPLSHSLSPDDSHLHSSSPSPSPSPPPTSAAASPDSYKMRSSSAIPSVIYDEQPPYASTSHYPGYGYDYGYAPFGVPIESQVDYHESERRAAAMREPSHPPPPPPPQGSSWDFLDPFFNSYQEGSIGYYSGRSVGGSPIGSTDSSEIRAKEGIPALEEDSESEAVKEKGVLDSGVGTSKRVVSPRKDKNASTSCSVGDESKSSSASSKLRSIGEEEKESDGSIVSSKLHSGEEEGGRKNKRASFDGGSSLISEDSRPAGNSSSLSAHDRKDFVQVVDEIKESFRSAADCGREVLGMLEAGKVPYRPTCGLFGVIYSRILDLMAPPTLVLRSYFKHERISGASSLKNKARYTDLDKLSSMKSGSLSVTLEKLYMWEKRLYKEVKDEEKLQIMYDRKCRLLKELDERGAEPHKIDVTQASVRNLCTKISILIKSIDAISKRMHKIQEEELQPQLIELIQGLIRMWNSLLDCHCKQFQAIIDGKSHKLMAKTGIEINSIAKATRELEMELLNWCSCFSDWVSTQKAYIEALNGWLMKWLLQEQEVTPDGVVPFSPSKVGAPAVFIISNDWYHAIKRVSQDEVANALHKFATTVHQLWESQHEEHRQRLKADYLSRDFAIKQKSLQKENEMSGHLDLVSTTEIYQGNDDVHRLELDTMRKILDEERAKHEEIVKQIQELKLMRWSESQMSTEKHKRTKHTVTAGNLAKLKLVSRKG